MIDEEQGLETTPERKALLGTMADVRGTMGISLANIRAYLLTGEKKFADEFTKKWARNGKRFADLNGQKPLFTARQAANFEKLSKARAEFTPFPPKMFAIRGSNKWNMARYTLVKEAIPRAGKILDALLGPKDENGARTGGMVANQKMLLRADATVSAESAALLLKMQLFLLVLAVAIGAGVNFLMVRTIVRPVVNMTDAMGTLAEGDLGVEVPGQGQHDEIGAMARALGVFKQTASLYRASEARFQQLSN